jgi:hypothetical protein
VSGAEPAVAVRGGEGAKDPMLLPRLEGGQEGITVEVDVLEEGKEVAPVRSLLRCGADGDGVGGGNLCSQVSSL